MQVETAVEEEIRNSAQISFPSYITLRQLLDSHEPSVRRIFLSVASKVIFFIQSKVDLFFLCF